MIFRAGRDREAISDNPKFRRGLVFLPLLLLLRVPVLLLLLRFRLLPHRHARARKQCLFLVIVIINKLVFLVLFLVRAVCLPRLLWLPSAVVVPGGWGEVGCYRRRRKAGVSMTERHTLIAGCGVLFAIVVVVIVIVAVIVGGGGGVVFVRLEFDGTLTLVGGGHERRSCGFVWSVYTRPQCATALSQYGTFISNHIKKNPISTSHSKKNKLPCAHSLLQKSVSHTTTPKIQSVRVNPRACIPTYSVFIRSFWQLCPSRDLLRHPFFSRVRYATHLT